MKSILLSFPILFLTLGITAAGPNTRSFMSDKTEIPVDLEIAGAEALCQTDDGFVWIAQYSGLARYDSKEYVTYKSFTDGDKEYSIVNVKALASEGNTLYIATNNNVFVHKDHKFSCIEGDFGIIRDIVLDDVNDLLYVSSIDKGLTLYDINNDTFSKLPLYESGSVYDVALDIEGNNYYYQLDTVVYDKDGNTIYGNENIYELYSHNDVLYIGHSDGLICRYDFRTKSFLENLSVGNQINQFLYYDDGNILFVGLEKNGLCCIDFSYEEPSISFASDLINKTQLVDLMIDYQGNLWIASHASGVSLIAKNSILDLLYDDPTWKKLTELKNIVAIERYQNILYFATAAHVFLYDLTTNQILPDGAIMEKLLEYCETNGKTSYTIRDLEVFNGKMYVLVGVIGCLIEYDLTTENIVIYDAEYMLDPLHLDKMVGTVNTGSLNASRTLRSFDNFIVFGYEEGIVKFDGEKFSIMNIGQPRVLFITKTNDGKILINRSAGIIIIEPDFSSTTKINTIKDVDGAGGDGNILKVLVDGDYIYHTLNSRLFRLEKSGNDYIYKEIFVPFAKGSLIELSKISYVNKKGETIYKYVIVSETQVYIVDSLSGDRLENYEFYDDTNGFPSASANTSGYYDKDEQKYYFQTKQGIFVYDFGEEKDTVIPVKIETPSVDLDGVSYYGNTINIKKDVYRVTINLSIFGFKPNKGYTVYYKLDGLDTEYHTITGDDRNINYTNVRGGSYTFHAYAVDEYGQESNRIEILLIKERHVYEQVWFWVVVAILGLALVVGIAFFIIRTKTKQALKKQLEYKNITVESIQAIARTIDAKDEYTNGHSTRVGYYSKLIAQHLGMSEDEVDNIYYIALLHDIGKIAIPDKILNKPGRLTDEEFAVMRSHTTRGAKILRGISTIPHIVEGAKYHHEKYDGTGYPEGLKGEEIPFVARIICCADCFDAMASKRVYKEPFSAEIIINEFKRCEGTQFDPKIAEVVIDMMAKGILKPYSDENMYLGEDGKTHRIVKSGGDNKNNEQ